MKNMDLSEPYSKREIDQLHTGLHEKLDSILSEARKTNGRIGKLEQWRSFITGGLAVLSVLVVPVLIYVIRQLFI